MIEVTKGPVPGWLTANQESKTQEYIAAPSGNKPSPWRAAEVVNALREEGRDKCMYCEGLVNDVAYLAVEHIRPKESFPEMVLSWENLGLACTRCNTNKGAYWTDNEGLTLLNPYVDAPSDHISFVGPIVVSAYGSSRGENTVRKMRFSERDDLVLSRMRRIQELDLRLRRWDAEPDTEKKSVFAEDVTEAIDPSAEFSAALAAYARHRGFPC